MVSHDLHRVMKESTQVLCLYRHICCMGQPETLIKNSQFNDLFADQMEELMATYEHHHNHCHKD
jgi:zinc transport system ATP-binding protein